MSGGSINRNHFDDVVPTDHTLDSANCFLERASGRRLEKSGSFTSSADETLTGELFTVTGSVLILTAYGEVSAASNQGSLANVRFYLDDETVEANITAAGNVVSSATGVGSIFIKDKPVANAVTVINSDQCRVTEPPSDKKSHHPFIVSAKNGATTKIKVDIISTAGTDVVTANLDVDFYITYVPLNGGTITAI